MMQIIVCFDVNSDEIVVEWVLKGHYYNWMTVI